MRFLMSVFFNKQLLLVPLEMSKDPFFRFLAQLLALQGDSVVLATHEKSLKLKVAEKTQLQKSHPTVL